MNKGPNREDIRDRKKTTVLIVSLSALLLVVAVTLVFLVGPIVLEATESGLGLGISAVIAFCVALIVLVVMALTAGDGLLGEIQFMIGGFIGFFVILWLMIAWVF